MIRAIVAGLGGLLLILLESLIVVNVKGYETIDFGGIHSFVSVWAMNFFLLFAILTQMKPWVLDKLKTKVESLSRSEF